VTDAMSLGNIHGISRVAPVITRALTALGQQENVSRCVIRQKAVRIVEERCDAVNKLCFLAFVLLGAIA